MFKTETEANGFAALLELLDENDGWTYDVIVRDDGTAVVRVITADGTVMGDV